MRKVYVHDVYLANMSFPIVIRRKGIDDFYVKKGNGTKIPWPIDEDITTDEEWEEIQRYYLD